MVEPGLYGGLSNKTSIQAALQEERRNRQRLQQQVDELLLRLDCLVCRTNERHTALQPCSHVVACRDCAQRLQKCPLCRSPVISRLDIFLA